MSNQPASPPYVAVVADRVQFFEGGRDGIQSLQISTNDLSHLVILMRSTADLPSGLHFSCNHGCDYDAIERAELSATGLVLSLRGRLPLGKRYSGYQIAWSLAGSHRESITRGLESLFRDTQILRAAA